MTDPFLDSLATALATQVASGLSSAGSKALEKVRALVRGKAEEDRETRTALEEAERTAGEAEIRALAERLDQVREQDREFADRLSSEGEPVHREINAGEDGVVNVNSGNVDKLVQARDIQGGITFN